MQVFIETDPFEKIEDQHYALKTIALNEPTNLTGILIKYATFCLRKIFKPGFAYRRAGVMFTQLIPEHQIQKSIFDKSNPEKLKKVQQAMDHINAITSRNKVQFACQGIEKKWTTKRDQLSKRFTTAFDEFPVAYL